MECAYWDAGTCRSCTWLEVPYPEQVAAKQDAVQRTLELVPHATDIRWLPPRLSAETGFRTRAKMVVGGTSQHPTLGILDAERHGVDLRDCPVMDPALRAAMPGLAGFVRATGLIPYDVPRRSGELKYVLVTVGDGGALMVRFVLRSRRQLGTLHRNLDLLSHLVPASLVVTANIHPVHEAIVEGPEEIVLSAARTLPMRVGDVVLQPGPRAFSQTNTSVAGDLYRQTASWVNEGCARSLWDLYCGVGGFALHAALAGVPQVTGVELSDQAIRSARRAAAELRGPGRRAHRDRGEGLATHAASTTGADPGPGVPIGSDTTTEPGTEPDTDTDTDTDVHAATASGTHREPTFIAGDATQWALHQDTSPDAVVVNPPRRGIGAELAGWLDRSGVATLVYSSCNPSSLAQDLMAMPHLVPVEGRLFDMFPHTAHAEVAVLLQRRP